MMIRWCRQHRPWLLLCAILFVATFQVYLFETASPYVLYHPEPTIAGHHHYPPTAKQATSIRSLPQNKTLSKLQLMPGPIFYNLFVPPTDLPNTKRILQEQLQQHAWSDPNSAIHYTLIGNKNVQEMKDYVSSLCPRNCVLREHLTSGDEQHTLQSLWEYCLDKHEDNQDWLVTYIHDKGSFHPTESNEKARRMATKAALECRTLWPSTKNPRSCNICMGAFHVFPQYLASANMWTARCSYIRQLYPPKDYPARLQEMFDQTLNHSTLQYTSDYACLRPYHEAPNFWGLGRYALEKWPLSHPEVKPCDVLTVGEGQLSWEDFPQTWTPKLQRAPHDNAKASGIQTGPYKSTWARLKGRLFEWKFVYQEEPSNSSWIWKWYKGYEEGTPGFLKQCQAKVVAFGETRKDNSSSMAKG